VDVVEVVVVAYPPYTPRTEMKDAYFVEFGLVGPPGTSSSLSPPFLLELHTQKMRAEGLLDII
jgi:hypothetical protein